MSTDTADERIKFWQRGIAKLKRFKQHIPMTVAVVTTVTATMVAEHYRQQLIKLKTVNSDEWPTFEVHPDLYMDVVKRGATLKLRMFSDGDRECVQTTTLDDFPSEAEEEYGNQIPNV